MTDPLVTVKFSDGSSGQFLQSQANSMVESGIGGVVSVEPVETQTIIVPEQETPVTQPDIVSPEIVPPEIITPTINVPADYVYSDDPSDVFVKMANEGVSVGDQLKYVQEHPDAIRGAYASQLADKIQEQLDVVKGLKGESQFDAYKQMGIIPEDAEFVSGNDGNWGYTSQSSGQRYQVPSEFVLNNQELDYLKSNYPEVYKYYTEEGLTSAFQKYGDILTQGKVEAAIVKVNPDLLKIYKDAGGGQIGVDAVNKELVALQAKGVTTEKLPTTSFKDVALYKGQTPQQIVAKNITQQERQRVESQLYPDGFQGFSTIYPINDKGQRISISRDRKSVV